METHTENDEPEYGATQRKAAGGEGGVEQTEDD